MPVYGTIASQYNNEGLNLYFDKLKSIIVDKTGFTFPETTHVLKLNNHIEQIIPNGKVRYLAEIAEAARNYNKTVEEQAAFANRLQALAQSLREFEGQPDSQILVNQLNQKITEIKENISKENLSTIENWESKKQRYKGRILRVRGSWEKDTNRDTC